MYIIDNFLDDDVIDKMFSDISGQSFPWYYFVNSVQYDSKHDVIVKNYKDYFPASSFRHTFIKQTEINSSMYFNIIEPFVNKLISLSDARIQIFNLNTNLLVSSESLYTKTSYPHTDVLYADEHHENFDCYTGLFYLNTCGGDTVFFDHLDDGNVIEKLRIKPVKNKFVFFKSTQLHSSPVAGDTFRFVINVNFYLPKNKLNLDGVMAA